MDTVRVESNTLAEVAYDAGRKLLEITFRTRHTYQYFEVPPPVVEQLLEAPSKGQYFNLAIRGKYRYERVRGVDSLF